MVRVFVFLQVCLTFLATSVFAQAGPAPKPGDDLSELLYLIYDSSNSMWGELSDDSRKYEAGRNAIGSVLTSGFENKDLAFRAYGHRSKTDCRDSELIIPPASADSARPGIEKAVTGIRPTGKTPISYSLRESLKDFGDRKGDILLISDGIETCDIDPCTLMEEWRNSGVTIRVHVVGVGLNEIERNAMTCVADTSGGQYFDAGSEKELAEALNEAKAASEVPKGEPEPVVQTRGYALIIRGADETGRAFILGGSLYQNGQEVMTLTSNGRNRIEEPGDYEMKAGVVLADGSIYEPITKSVTIEEPGDLIVDVQITRPAIVSASFSEDGESTRGSFVTAYQDQRKVFGFRAFDEALARPGDYEFRASPNADNELRVKAALIEGQETIVDFELVKTVRFYVQYKLPNGEILTRNAELYRDGKKVYSIHAHNGGLARPGSYELRSVDDKVPLETPVSVDIESEGQIIEVDLPAGYLTINYTGSDEDYLRSIRDRAFFQRRNGDGDDFGPSVYANIDTPIPVSPQRYRVIGHSGFGYFDPVDIDVANGESRTATITPMALGKVILSYAASENYKKTPDRAALYPTEGPKLIGSNSQLDIPHKVPPGRYRVVGWASAGDIEPQEVVVKVGETTRVVLRLKSE